MKKHASIIVALALCFCIGCKEEFGIRGVVPPTGALGGGEQVEILGSGFERNVGMSVYFGNQKANNVVVSSTTKLIVHTPSANEPESVDIRIAMDNGREYLLPRAFRYVEKQGMDIRDLGVRKSRRERPNQ